MGWWERTRGRNEAATAKIAKHPFAAWIVHAALFAGFALVLQRMRGAPFDWVGPVVMGTLIAGSLVAGTVFGYRRQQRSEKP